MSTEPDDPDSTLTRKQYILLSIALVTALIALIIAGTLWGTLNRQDAQLLVTGLLAAATFSYVTLTFWMASAMQSSVEQAEEAFKHRRKEDIIDIITDEIDPLLTDLRNHHYSFNATSIGASDVYPDHQGGLHHRLPAIETTFDSATAAARISPEVDVQAGTIYEYYHDLGEYIVTQEQAVQHLQITLIENQDNHPITDEFEAYAASALALEPVNIDRGLWEPVEDDIVQMRSHIDNLTEELLSLRRDLKSTRQELRHDLGMARANLAQDHYISPNELEV